MSHESLRILRKLYAQKGEKIMLKGIPSILSPELLKVLCEMGHSDRLVIADGNFPTESMGKNCITIRMDGHGVPEILDAILQVFPLDTYVEKPVNLMELMPSDVGKVATPIWDTYKEIYNSELFKQKFQLGYNITLYESTLFVFLV